MPPHKHLELEEKIDLIITTSKFTDKRLEHIENNCIPTLTSEVKELNRIAAGNMAKLSIILPVIYTLLGVSVVTLIASLFERFIIK